MSNEYNDLLDILAKKEAPVVSRQRRKILKESNLSAAKRKKLAPKKKDAVQKEEKEVLKFEEILNFEQPLAKNEYEITENAKGEIKMEFGPEIPESVRKRAIAWAQKRGLKAKEMSLGKSVDMNYWIVFSK